MALTTGARLGPYEIVSPLGAGGMGEVYKARDLRLDRTVAIKILPSADPDLKARFEREARAIAALQHPHICALFDVGAEGGTDYLVMEHLEGETLAARLERGALKLDDALRIGVEIASALDAAHRAGIVHRDLKPGNVMLTKSGAKLLDFGLAKPTAPPIASAGMSMLPTTPQNLTAQGTILGTFQYMAPEQLEGGETDARTDIFAFGATLYEMVTGRKAFAGKSQASLITAIMSAEPPAPSTIQATSPPALDRTIGRCLAKDPDERWQSARDLLAHLQWIADLAPGAVSTAAAAIVPRRGRREAVAWSVALLSLAGVVALGVTLGRRPHTPDVRASRFPVPAPDQTTFGGTFGSAVSISPDGRHLVFVATDDRGVSALWLRPIDALVARPVPGTEEAGSPFWSPDGRFVGFFGRGKLRKVEIAGGPAQTLCDAPFNSTGATWSRDGVIVFAPSRIGGLFRVSASGGQASPVTVPNKTRSESHGWPSFLPDGRHFLFLVRAGPRENWSVSVGSLDSPATKQVLQADSAAVYAGGSLLFVRQSTLMAQPFDVTRLLAIGDASPVAEQAASSLFGGAEFAVSETGTLVYRTGTRAQMTQLAWVDRAGKALSVAAPPAQYGNVALSPDQRRVAFDRFANSYDVWILDLDRHITSRFTFQPPNNNVPVWSPEGRTIVFASSRNGGLDLFQRPSNMGGPDEPLLKLGAPPIVYPFDWSADGRYVAYYRTDPKTQLDVWILPLFGDRKPFPFLRGDYNESQAQFSSDGKWMAYESDESGAPQIYVQSFPTPAGTSQVSADGGTQPRWRSDGKELFYIAPDRKLMAVTVKTAPTFEAEAPRPLFETKLPVSPPRQAYSVAADGQRFLLNEPVAESSSPLIVVLNWPATLKK